MTVFAVEVGDEYHEYGYELYATREAAWKAAEEAARNSRDNTDWQPWSPSRPGEFVRTRAVKYDYGWQVWQEYKLDPKQNFLVQYHAVMEREVKE